MKKEPITYQQIQQTIDQQYFPQRDSQPSQAQSSPAPSASPSSSPQPTSTSTAGGRFDFDDGGIYVGGWQDGKAHGHGVCTGPKGQGEYSGSFSYGFEVCGVYKWPSGAIYEGQWSNGKRHGLGVEFRGKWIYKGEWTQGYKGRYGVRGSAVSCAKYEGTWANGLHDGYGSETYADSGTYQGQWLRGMRHGYGVRHSAPYGHCSVTKDVLMKNSNSLSIQSLDTESETESVYDPVKRDATMRGGFVLVAKSQPTSTLRRRHSSLGDKTSPPAAQKTGFLKGFRLKKQKSTGDIDMRSARSTSSSVASSIDSASSAPIASKHLYHSSRDPIDPDTVSNNSFLAQEAEISDPSTTETYMGEWKNDKRCGFGICERSDGLRYEGEWYNNKKYGYGVTFFRDGTREEGKYKNNCLVTNAKKKHLFVLRSSKLRDRIESAVGAARQAQQIALQKADIAISRTTTARSKADQSEQVAAQSRTDSALGYSIAKQCGGSDAIKNMHSLMYPCEVDSLTFPPYVETASSLTGSKQYLDVNEPFGGRRGSFRSGSNSQLNENTRNSSFTSQSNRTFDQSHQQEQQNQSNRLPHSLAPSGASSSLHSQQMPSQSSHQHAFIHHQNQQYQANNDDSSADHLDQYQKLVSRYGKVSKPPSFEPPSFSRLNINRSQNLGSSDLNKIYGTSSSIDSGRETDNSSDAGLALPTPIDMSSESSSSTKTPLRTASLYRLPASTGASHASKPNDSGGTKSGPLKRKPSLQSISSKPIKEPVMSREEVSVLSHATREQRRQEAERAERLTHNPLLYFVDPQFKEWLSRQQIIIAVILINITLAIIFFKLLG
uniref:Junctophilin n=2 Tax=Tetranychus urticae TaxID=32264 RepID=T1KY97_TETUR